MGIIYVATNKFNQKLYIGKSSRTLKARMDEHEKESVNPKTYFHNAIHKYGSSSFSWKVLEESTNNDDLSMLEVLYIDLFSTSIKKYGYNTTHGGDGVILNYESRLKMSKTKKGKPSLMKGRHFSIEATKNMRASRIGIWDRNKHPMLGHKQSDESIAKMKETKKKNVVLHSLQCRECGSAFTAKVPFAIFCSNKCKLADYRRRRKT